MVFELGIKAKMSEDEISDNIADIFLILENLVATDSYLIYHQEMMGKRLIDALNEPRVDIELMVLKKMAVNKRIYAGKNRFGISRASLQYDQRY